MVDGKVNAIDAFIQQSKKLILKGNEIECLSGYDVPLFRSAGAINEIYDTWC